MSDTQSFDALAAERTLRVELAAFYRIVDRRGMTDLIHNHISARAPGRRDQFLIATFGLDYSEITASNLVRIDLDGRVLAPAGDALVNRAGFLIHGAIHAARPDLTCIVHVHTPATVAVASLECGVLPMNQSALRFMGDLAYHDYEGPVFRADEGARLVASLGGRNNTLLRNHGALACGRSVAEAYVNLMSLEAACRIQVQTLACGQPVRPISPEAIAEAKRVYALARDPDPASAVDYPGPELEWAAALRTLDAVDPSYRA